MVTLISEYDFHERESKADFGLRGACQIFARECFKTTSKIHSNFRHRVPRIDVKVIFPFCPLHEVYRIFSRLFPGLGFIFFQD